MLYSIAKVEGMCGALEHTSLNIRFLTTHNQNMKIDVFSGLEVTKMLEKTEQASVPSRLWALIESIDDDEDAKEPYE